MITSTTASTITMTTRYIQNRTDKFATMCVCLRMRICLSIVLIIQPTAKRHSQFRDVNYENKYLFPYAWMCVCVLSTIQINSSLYDWQWFKSIRFDSNRSGSRNDSAILYGINASFLLCSIFIWIKLSPLYYFSLICRFTSWCGGKANNYQAR